MYAPYVRKLTTRQSMRLIRYIAHRFDKRATARRACEVVTKDHSTPINAASSDLLSDASTQHQLVDVPPRDDQEATMAESNPGCTLRQRSSGCALQG